MTESGIFYGKISQVPLPLPLDLYIQTIDIILLPSLYSNNLLSSVLQISVAHRTSLVTKAYGCGMPNSVGRHIQSVSWSLAEFRHNKIVQSPHQNYFNVSRQHKEK